MKSSAAVLRWNRDFSSLGSDESVSFPFLNSMFQDGELQQQLEKFLPEKEKEKVGK